MLHFRHETGLVAEARRFRVSQSDFGAPLPPLPGLFLFGALAVWPYGSRERAQFAFLFLVCQDVTRDETKVACTSLFLARASLCKKKDGIVTKLDAFFLFLLSVPSFSQGSTNQPRPCAEDYHQFRHRKAIDAPKRSRYVLFPWHFLYLFFCRICSLHESGGITHAYRKK